LRIQHVYSGVLNLKTTMRSTNHTHLCADPMVDI